MAKKPTNKSKTSIKSSKSKKNSSSLLSKRGIGIALVVLVAAVVAISVSMTNASSTYTTLNYGSGVDQFENVYASKTPNSPVVLIVHGGGWNSSPTANLEGKAALPLRAAGFTVFTVNYDDDSTQPAFPTEINDIVAATQYAEAHAAQYNGNPSEINYLGGSSGAQLAAYAAEELNSTSAGAIKSVATLSGPFDFPSLISYWSSVPPGNNAPLHLSNETTALGCVSVATCSTAVEQKWSPDDNVTSQDCSTAWLIVNGNNELMPVAQANSMTAALKSAKCANVTENIFADSKHAFDYWTPIKPTVISFFQANK